MADQPHPRVPPSVWRNPWHFLAFGLGSGTLPKAPGTWGSLLGLAAVPLLQWLPLWGYAGVLLAASLLGIWLCGRVADDLGVHDHEGIVWDEFVGIWLTLFLAPPGVLSLCVGFVLFLFFDILKPWPLGWADRHVEGGLGIMLDDLLAGLLAFACLQLLVYLVV